MGINQAKKAGKEVGNHLTNFSSDQNCFHSIVFVWFSLMPIREFTVRNKDWSRLSRLKASVHGFITFVDNISCRDPVFRF
jgi:hypothetical protein